jgi:hypothetical protein
MLSFTYQSDMMCTDSMNGQDDNGDVICTDIAALTNDVTISCAGTNGGAPLTVTPSDVTSGAEFSVVMSTGAMLPDSITCTVSTGTFVDLQEVVISTVDRLSLKDKYGSLLVQSCDDQQCLVPVTMTYLIKNVGTNNEVATITELTRETSLAPGSRTFLGSLSDGPVIRGDEITSAEERFVLDICEDLNVLITTNVGAENELDVACAFKAAFQLTRDGLTASPTRSPTEDTPARTPSPTRSPTENTPARTPAPKRFPKPYSKGKGKGKGAYIASKGKGKGYYASKGKGKGYYASKGKGKGYYASKGKGKGYYASKGKGKGYYASKGKGKTKVHYKPSKRGYTYGSRSAPKANPKNIIYVSHSGKMSSGVKMSSGGKKMSPSKNAFRKGGKMK